MADYENGIPNTTYTLHRIGSLTKPITALGLLKLISRDGRIALSDTLGKFFSNIPTSWSNVKVIDLMTHTSGIPDHFGDMAAVPVEKTNDEILKVFRLNYTEPLHSVPGTEYAYNNFGYVGRMKIFA